MAHGVFLIRKMPVWPRRRGFGKYPAAKGNRFLRFAIKSIEEPYSKSFPVRPCLPIFLLAIIKKRLYIDFIKGKTDVLQNRLHIVDNTANVRE
jgi:hypothetical protein